MVAVYRPVLSLAISDEKTGCPAQSALTRCAKLEALLYGYVVAQGFLHLL